VSVTDSGGLSDTASVSVEILDVNEPPVFKQQSYEFELAENQDGSDKPVVGHLSASRFFDLTPEDDDVNEDDETITVRGEMVPEAGGRSRRAAAPAVLPVVSAQLLLIDDDARTEPRFRHQSYGFTLKENQAGPLSLGTLTATDQDAGDIVTYAIAAGDTSRFAINRASGELIYIGPGEDYESEPNRYDLTVSATDRDGLSDRAAVTVEILDVNEPPVFKQQSYEFELAENQDGSDKPVVLGTLTATDQDAGDIVTYAIAGGDTGLFAIDGTSGELSYVGPGEDYEREPNRYDLTVSATDDEGLSSEAGVTVTVTDEADAIARARLRRVNEAILPELSRVIVSSAVEIVARRIKEAKPRASVGQQDFIIAGHSDIVDALIANEATLNEGAMDWKRALAGSSFTLGVAGPDTSPGRVTLWGEGHWRDLMAGGEADPVAFEDDVLGARVGVDAWLGEALLAGMALSLNWGAFDYIDRDEAGYLAIEGRHKSRVMSLYPYAGLWLHERLGFWGTVGYGVGEVEIDDGEAGSQWSDGTLRAAAVGGQVQLLPESAGGTTVTLKGEAWQALFDLEGNGGLMQGFEVHVYRLRVGLEGSHAYQLVNNSILTPSLELGLRHDGGDGETGRGMELGGGLRWATPRGLAADVHGRMLLAHQGDIEEWGVSGLVALGPNADGRGLSINLRPSWGEADGGVARLWQDGLWENRLRTATDPLPSKAETPLPGSMRRSATGCERRAGAAC
jgi:hypothetical protein